MLRGIHRESIRRFVLVGAPKSGTTSLYRYLSRHPEVFLPEQKELHFFSADHLLRRNAGPGDSAGLRSICSNASDYVRHFSEADSRGVRLIGDVSPSYFYYEGVEARIRDEIDDPFVAVVLRDPCERAYSQYLHLRRDGRETLPFEDAIDAEEGREAAGWSGLWSYTGRSFYAEHVERYLSAFPPGRFRVLLFEEMRDDPVRFFADLLAWLGIEPSSPFDTGQIHNAGGVPRSRTLARASRGLDPIRPWVRKCTSQDLRDLLGRAIRKVGMKPKPNMREDTRRRLRGVFAADIMRLESLLARPTGWFESPVRGGATPHDKKATEGCWGGINAFCSAGLRREQADVEG